MFASGVAAWTISVVVGARPGIDRPVGRFPPFRAVLADHRLQGMAQPVPQIVLEPAEPLDLSGRVARGNGRVPFDLDRATLRRPQHRLGVLTGGFANLTGGSLGGLEKGVG